MLASPYRQYDVLHLGGAELHRQPDGICSIITKIDGESLESEPFQLDGGAADVASLLTSNSFKFTSIRNTSANLNAENPNAESTQFSLNRNEQVLIVKAAELDGKRRLYRCFIEASGNSALWLSGSATIGAAASSLFSLSVPLVSFVLVAALLIRNLYERRFLQSLLK